MEPCASVAVSLRAMWGARKPIARAVVGVKSCMMSDNAVSQNPAESGKHIRRTSGARVALLSIAVGALLYCAREVFIPVALALLFAVVLSSAVEALHRRRLPRAVGSF